MGFDKIKNSKEPGHTVTIRSRWNQVWMVLSWPISGINQRPSGLQGVWGSLLWLHPLQQTVCLLGLGRLHSSWLLFVVVHGYWYLKCWGFCWNRAALSPIVSWALMVPQASTFLHKPFSHEAWIGWGCIFSNCLSWSLTQCLALDAFPKPFNAIKIKYHLGDLGYQVWLPVWGETTLATSEIQLLCIKSEKTSRKPHLNAGLFPI